MSSQRSNHSISHRKKHVDSSTLPHSFLPPPLPRSLAHSLHPCHPPLPPIPPSDPSHPPPLCPPLSPSTAGPPRPSCSPSARHSLPPSLQPFLPVGLLFRHSPHLISPLYFTYLPALPASPGPANEFLLRAAIHSRPLPSPPIPSNAIRSLPLGSSPHSAIFTIVQAIPVPACHLPPLPP